MDRFEKYLGKKLELGWWGGGRGAVRRSKALRVTLIQIINAGEGVEKMEPSYTIVGNVNWYSHYGKQ